MEENDLSLGRMQVAGWIILAVLTIGSLFLMSFTFALSVFIGGVLSIGSFWVSAGDIQRLVGSVTSLSLPDARKAQAQLGQKKYLVKFWLRIVIIGVVLLFLIKGQMVNVFGLLIGLSTVVLSAAYLSMSVVGRYIFRGRR